MCGFADAKSGCSGVGGAVKCRKSVKQIFAMQLHHRGSKRYITPSSRRSDASSFRLLISVFLVCIFVFLATEPLVCRCLCQINLLAVLAHTERVVFICQHEGKGQVDALVKGMEVPPECRLFPQQDDKTWCNAAVSLHPFLHRDS